MQVFLNDKDRPGQTSFQAPFELCEVSKYMLIWANSNDSGTCTFAVMVNKKKISLFAVLDDLRCQWLQKRELAVGEWTMLEEQSTQAKNTIPNKSKPGIIFQRQTKLELGWWNWVQERNKELTNCSSYCIWQRINKSALRGAAKYWWKIWNPKVYHWALQIFPRISPNQVGKSLLPKVRILREC